MASEFSTTSFHERIVLLQNSTAIVPKKYLTLQWHTNLGFNNMRFITEEGLYLAQLLGRRLLLPTKLRMRKCINETLCKDAGCSVRDNTYWCPLSQFLSWKALKSVHAIITPNPSKFQMGKSVHSVKNAFAPMFSESTVSLDQVPTDLKSSLNTSGHYVGTVPFQFPYWKFHLGCELSYFKTVNIIWNSSKSTDRRKRIIGFVDMYQSEQADILNLRGVPHYIGLTPTGWHSSEALKQSQVYLSTYITI